MESGSDQLFAARITKKISRQLFDCELIERHVIVESRDDPVSIWPHRTKVVMLVSIGISVTCKVEPMQSPLLAKMFRVQETVDGRLIVCFRRILLEFSDFFKRRWQTYKIEGNATQEYCGLRGWRRGEGLLD